MLPERQATTPPVENTRFYMAVTKPAGASFANRVESARDAPDLYALEQVPAA
ncbi:MAG: hypothetical protein GTO41_01425 [Burkholderiales bacterium]|nr:hypothetical protein [Burkholderiales bacterium]